MASSAFMDAFAGHRRSQGLPGTSLSLGHMLDVGIVSNILEYQEHLHRMGLHGNNEAEFHRFCEAAISKPGNGHLLAGVTPSSLTTNSARYPVDTMHWHDDPRFSHLLLATEHLANSDESSGALLVSDDNTTDSLISRIHKRVARCLYIAAEDIDVAQPINSYGMDSMVAAEILNWIFSAFNARISLLNLLHPTMSVEKLATEVESAMKTA